MESRHNETHVITVDAAPGADLLSRTRFPERKSDREGQRGRNKKGKRRRKHMGEWAKRTTLYVAASRSRDIRP